MLKVVIFGYFGCGNIGDETNLSHLITLLREMDPRIGITVVSACPEETGRALQVATVGKWDFRGINRAFQAANLLISGGGALFQDRTSFRSLLYYSALVLWAKFLKIKVFLYGQGIGPLKSRPGRWLASLALSRVDLITVFGGLECPETGDPFHGGAVIGQKPSGGAIGGGVLGADQDPETFQGRIDPPGNHAGTEEFLGGTD
jgi:hypothetical protein